MNLTYPVLLQSYVDEFKLPEYKYEAIGKPEKVLAKVEEGKEFISNSRQTKFEAGVGTMLYIIRWSR